MHAQRVVRVRALRLAPGEELHRPVSGAQGTGRSPPASAAARRSSGPCCRPRPRAQARTASRRAGARSRRRRRSRARGSSGAGGCGRAAACRRASQRRRACARYSSADESSAHRRQPDELHAASRSSRSGPSPYGQKATGMTAHVSAGPASSRIDAVSGKPANSQPTPGKPEQAQRKLVARERRRAAPPHALRDRAGVLPRASPRARRARPPAGARSSARPLARTRRTPPARRAPPARARAPCHGSRAATAVAERRPALDAVRLDGRERDARRRSRRPSRPRRTAEARLPAAASQSAPSAAQRDEREPDQEQHQPAEHVQLRVQVDDHVAGLAAPVERLVDEPGTACTGPCSVPTASAAQPARTNGRSRPRDAP